jgi:hypothetical protein
MVDYQQQNRSQPLATAIFLNELHNEIYKIE